MPLPAIEFVTDEKIALYADINKIKIDPEIGIKRIIHEDGFLELFIFYEMIPHHRVSRKSHLSGRECILCSCSAMPKNHCHMCDPNCISHWLALGQHKHVCTGSYHINYILID
jgi:hypothetical protein